MVTCRRRSTGGSSFRHARLSGSGANIGLSNIVTVGPIGGARVPVFVSSCMLVSCNANTVVTMPTRSAHS